MHDLFLDIKNLLEKRNNWNVPKGQIDMQEIAYLCSLTNINKLPN